MHASNIILNGHEPESTSTLIYANAFCIAAASAAASSSGSASATPCTTRSRFPRSGTKRLALFALSSAYGFLGAGTAVANAAPPLYMFSSWEQEGADSKLS